jgi:hypothetical protein
MVSSRTGPQHEAAVAITAFDEFLVAHFKINPRMAERAATAIAHDASIIDFDYFGRIDRHLRALGGVERAEYSGPPRHRNTCELLLEPARFRA